MAQSMLRRLNRLRRPWKPIVFDNHNYLKIPSTQRIEEENIPEYSSSRYYPTLIGEVLKNRYQVVGKLGYGTTSTVWLARDMQLRHYVTLKIFINSKSMGQQLDDELKMYKHVTSTNTTHPGRMAVRSLLDNFDIKGFNDYHQCLVHVPLWESVAEFLPRNPIQRLPKPVLAFVLQRVFLALDYLHTQCKVIHIDIKADNIMFEIADEYILNNFEQDELQSPCPRKETDGRTIYASRELGMPKNMGAPVLCDFGSAVVSNVEHLEDVQPDVYRAPEVILEVPWSSSIDIWNVGCMIWNIFDGGSLFTGRDPEFQTYRSRTHLAQMISLLGPPPISFINRGNIRQKFFDEDGEFLFQDMVHRSSLEERETTLKGDDKTDFLRFVRRMLQWDPEKRSSAKSLADDDWIVRQLQE